MDMSETDDPFRLFAAWFAEAKAAEPNDANAMALATASAEGAPSVRIVLMKGFDQAGFVFYTNLESRKGEELAARPQAALCFHWKSLLRQIRIEGPVQPVAPAEADAYYAGRPRDSRLGAWASAQSRPLDSRETLISRVRQAEARFAAEEAVPRPPFWSGFRLVPARIEFWQDRPYRLHDRIQFERRAGGWSATRLYP
jgi:pyridoxamine 5'-phosphate oxidase